MIIIATVKELGDATSDSVGQALSYGFVVVAGIAISAFTISKNHVDNEKLKIEKSTGKSISVNFPPDRLLTEKGKKIRNIGYVSFAVLIIGFVTVKFVTGKSL